MRVAVLALTLARLTWRGFCWIVFAISLVLAAVGVVWYAVIGGAQWWNWGQMTPLPLLLLTLSQAAKSKSDRSSAGGVGDGPWGPP